MSCMLLFRLFLWAHTHRNRKYNSIASSVCYWFVAGSLAELSSAIPTSGGGEISYRITKSNTTADDSDAVYHWASITAGRYGRVCGWFAGWWNLFAWILGAASTTQIVASVLVSMYELFHDNFHEQRYQVFVTYIILTWLTCLLVAFANRLLPPLEAVGAFLTVAGFVVTVAVCAIMPRVRGQGYATDAFVWRDWQNQTGWRSNGFVFCAGMLNAAFACGTPDLITHAGQETTQPSRNIPLAILVQFVVGFVTGVCYMIAIFYGISDLDAVIDGPYGFFPLTEIYRQVTGSAGGALGILIVSLIPLTIGILGVYVTASRLLWALACDGATPFSGLLSRVSPTHKNPFNSILLCGLISTVLGCIYMGNTTAFSAFVGSFVVLSTLSYLAAILPHMCTRRSTLQPGWFWMKGIVGYVVNGVASLYIMAFVVIFCFPAAMPVDAESMNYTCLITGGVSLFAAAFWFWRRKEYRGPMGTD